MSRSHHDFGWRIAYVPHAAPGGPGYHRIVGWGWLSPLGVLGVAIGAAGLAFARPHPAWLVLVFGGFVSVWAGIVLNGVSERRRMRRVAARCVDLELRELSGTRMQSGGWALRAQMRYLFDGKVYDATPGQLGYVRLGSRADADAFAHWLRDAPEVTLYVDPRYPTRALFDRLRVPTPVD